MNPAGIARGRGSMDPRIRKSVADAQSGRLEVIYLIVRGRAPAVRAQPRRGCTASLA